MDERVMQFRVGVMFLFALLVTGILLVMFGKLPDFSGSYPIKVCFSDAGGVNKNTPVRKSGILIGRVSDVQLIDDDSKVLVTAEIQKGRFLYQNEDCFVTRNLLSGDTAMTFIAMPGKPGAGKVIEPDALIEGRITDDPTGLKRELQKPIDTVVDTGRALKEASDQLSRAARRVEEILDPETQKNVQSVLKDAAASLAAIRETLGDEENREKMTQAMKRLPDTLDNMSATFKSTNEALQKFTDRSADGKSPVDRMVETIEMTEQTVRKFSERGRNGEPAPTEQIAQAMENLNEITSVVRSILDRIDQGEGSLGALMRDRQLYDRLNCTAKNLEDISWKLKPIVADARVITDKIARHPGIIVRDAVRPQVGIK